MMRDELPIGKLQYVYSHPLITENATPLLPPMTHTEITTMERSIDNALEGSNGSPTDVVKHILRVDSNPVGRQMLIIYINQHIQICALCLQSQSIQQAIDHLQASLTEHHHTMYSLEYTQSPATCNLLWQINLSDVRDSDG